MGEATRDDNWAKERFEMGEGCRWATARGRIGDSAMLEDSFGMRIEGVKFGKLREDDGANESGRLGGKE